MSDAIYTSAPSNPQGTRTHVTDKVVRFGKVDDFGRAHGHRETLNFDPRDSLLWERRLEADSDTMKHACHQ